MGLPDWDIAGFTDEMSRLGKKIPTGELRLPKQVELNPEQTELICQLAGPEGPYVKPSRGMLNAFVNLWRLPPTATLKYARKWGVLRIGKTGRPCDGPQSYAGRESLETWRHLSRRACAVLNIAAALTNARRGPREDWLALSPIEKYTGDFFKELYRFDPGLFHIAAARGYPPAFDNFQEIAVAMSKSESEVLQVERAYLSIEVGTWLRLGRVGFALHINSERWQLVIDLKECVLSALALELAMTIAGTDTLYNCSGCGKPYVRETKPPKAGQANYCPECGRGEALRQADRRRREKVTEARRLAGEGVPTRDIAMKLNTQPANVRRWLKKGK